MHYGFEPSGVQRYKGGLSERHQGGVRGMKGSFADESQDSPGDLVPDDPPIDPLWIWRPRGSQPKVSYGSRATLQVRCFAFQGGGYSQLQQVVLGVLPGV